MAPGLVTFAGEMGDYGLVVWVDHGSEVITTYAHLSEVRVEAGTRVEGDDVLGLTGQTGNAAGPHLHFELWRWGRQTDPVPLLGGFPQED
jgi:murein DD-endopeptidase MepM/ murein hydrolase activator NlpD